MNKEYYEKQFNIFTEEGKKLERDFSRVSTLRVISFLAGLSLLLIGIFDDKPAAGVFGCGLLLLFLYFVKLHSDIVKKHEDVKSKGVSAGRYVDRFTDEWRNFTDSGEEFISEEDTVSRDIDLLGRASLFQLINVCHTKKGRKLFADELRLKKFDIDKLKKRNDSVKELMEKKEFAIDFEAAGIRLSEKKQKQDIDKFIGYCDDEKTGIAPLWMEVLRFVLPLAEITLIIIWAAGLAGYLYPLAGFLVLLAIAGFTLGSTEETIIPFYSMGNAVEDYEEMLLLIDNEDFNSELLGELKDYVSQNDGAVNAFKSLRRISQTYNISYNPFLHLFFTGIFMWDYQLAHFTSKWKRKYGAKLGRAFDIIAEFEGLLSLSVMGCVRDTAWADIYEDDNAAGLIGVDMYHPLLNPDTVVENSIELSGGITIITGSNMSGKTTFLRTIAVNLVLAYMGAPVCAGRLSANYMRIFTSMRVTDDVSNGISTFYAEILRIKSMAQYKENDVPMICLIDEIFKGTNSADRIVGAKEAITRLAGRKCITVVSTHDFELCSIEDKNNEKADNYHFEEYYDNEELKFDYKIRSGKCTTTNALAILRLAGFEV